MSPQHWARAQLRKAGVTDPSTLPKGVRDGIGETTYYNRCQLFWNDRKNFLDIAISPHDNVATFYLAPGYRRFGLFCQECTIDVPYLCTRQSRK